MRQGNKSDEEGYWLRYERRYLLLQLMAVLMVPVVLVSLLALLPEARAAQQGTPIKAMLTVLMGCCVYAVR